MALRAIHLRENNTNSRRSNSGGRAFPLGEAGRPGRPGHNPVDEIHAINRWLDVGVSARYSPSTATYCNVYAADFCYLAGVYLPRVWWTQKAITMLSKGATVTPLYGVSLEELRADDLFSWLSVRGPEFGWIKVTDPTALQNSANAGGIGIICADRAAPGLPGHITVVVPETAEITARRDGNGHLVVPVQSQAGAKNFSASTVAGTWWTGNQFKAHGFWIHP